MKSILSLDVSSRRTGWCFTANYIDFVMGNISHNNKLKTDGKLESHYNQLAAIIKEFKPEIIILEDTFGSRNIKTLKTLAWFAGVTRLCCYVEAKIEPDLVANTSSKSYFGVRDKKLFFNRVTELADIDECTLNFTKGNDMVDSFAMLIYYIDAVLGYKSYKSDEYFIRICNL